ncbi:MAG: hypothetical protein ABGZ37_07965 [Akkermansiaceae bacterium]
MVLVRNLIVVFAALALVGFVRLPHDNKVAADLREQHLLPVPISLDTREELGQTGLAIALGGLRPLIASMLNLQAHVHWENQEWYELEQTYHTIVALQPRTRYYWKTGAWHLYSNAYADYRDKPGLSDGRRKLKQREFFEKGIAFLERGVETNPHDWRLWAELGNALSQTWRPINLERAAEGFRKGFEYSGHIQLQRQHVYVLSRIPGREGEAWKYGREMWANPHNRKYNSPRTIFYTLQYRVKPPKWEQFSVEDIFESRWMAAMDVPDYWFRQGEGYPVNGIAELLNELCEEFNIPGQVHPLRFPPEQKFTHDPLSGEPFGTNPATGQPRERRWRSIWMDRPRDIYRARLRRQRPSIE